MARCHCLTSCCLTSSYSARNSACRRSASVGCARYRLWRRAFLLLTAAAVLSVLIPGAPLAQLMLSEDAERLRLLSENEQRLQRSLLFLDRYRVQRDVHQLQQRRNVSSPSFSSSHLHPQNIFPPDPRSWTDRLPATRDGPSSAAAATAQVSVTVLTMARGRRMKGVGHLQHSTQQYLTQSLAKLLQLLQDTSLTRTYSLQICNIDDQPHNFSEAVALEDLVPVFKRYGPSSSSSRARQPPGTVWEKLKEDYVFCLQQTLAPPGVRYALLVEDDAVAHDQLFPVLEEVLTRVLETPGGDANGAGYGTSPVAYVKLYHPQRLLGYISFEVERLAELLALSVLLGALLTLLRRSGGGGGGSGGGCGGGSGSGSGGRGTNRSTLLHRNHNHNPTPIPLHQQPNSQTPRRTRGGSLWARWLGWTVVVAVLTLVVGRTNLLELRRLSPQLYQVTPTPSCCTQSVLYTRAGGLGFSRYLLNVTCTSKRSTDVRMDEFRNLAPGGEGGGGRRGESSAPRRGLLVQPNLFYHIGLVSSLRTKEVSPLAVA